MTWNAILADESIRAVVLATPAETHYPMACQALEAGKHLFVEKPIAFQVEEAVHLQGLAIAGRRTLMVGHLMQYHPAFLAMLQLVRAGALGTIQYIYSNRLNLGRFRRHENILWSFAPHDVSMILALADGDPIRVEARGASYVDSGIADVTTTHMAFPGGLQAHIFVSWLHPYKEQRLVVVGERGMAVFDDSRDWSEKLTLYPHVIEWRDGTPRPQPAMANAVALEPAEPLRSECLHFLECVATGATPRTDAVEAIRVLQVLSAADRSLRETRLP